MTLLTPDGSFCNDFRPSVLKFTDASCLVFMLHAGKLVASELSIQGTCSEFVTKNFSLYLLLSPSARLSGHSSLKTGERHRKRTAYEIAPGCVCGNHGLGCAH